MCSIVGFVDSQVRRPEDAVAMLAKTRHRGPDAVGLYVDGRLEHSFKALADSESRDPGHVCLGHARLEIVGGKDGLQPIVGCEGRLALVHNGEIYNYRELRRNLADHTFSTESDSETLLHQVEEFHDGDLAEAVVRAMPYLDGMYAFAVTDGETLVIARDPVGKKPVYYVEGLPLFFASEPKALAWTERKIKRLPPGWILVADRHGVDVRQVRELPRPPIRLHDMDEALRAYEVAFGESIDKRTSGLGRVAVLLSGGVDSTLVARAIQARGIPVTGYCVGVEGSVDVEIASRAAREMGIQLRVTHLTEELVERVLPAVIEAIELNGMVQVEAAIPMYIAAAMAAADGHRVIFSGQAADELFGGYAWYRDVVSSGGHPELHERLWDDIGKLHIDTLEREDRMTMAHGLELRAPFLDRGVIDVAMQISPHLKVRDPDDRSGKRVHRELARRLGVPAYIATGDKVRAQDGSAIPVILQSLAERHFDGREISPVAITDYGSNYRYLSEQYGTPELAAYLGEVTRHHDIQVFTGSEATAAAS